MPSTMKSSKIDSVAVSVFGDRIRQFRRCPANGSSTCCGGAWDSATGQIAPVRMRGSMKVYDTSTTRLMNTIQTDVSSTEACTTG